MEKYRFEYIAPSTQIYVWENCQCILGHSEETGGTGEDDEFNSKEQTEFEEEDVAPNSPNLWEDAED